LSKQRSIWEEELAYQALCEMTLNDDRFLVVVDRDERPVGYVSLSDLVKAQNHKIEDETVVEEGKLNGRGGPPCHVRTSPNDLWSRCIHSFL
jgi:CBS domain-containing protein